MSDRDLINRLARDLARARGCSVTVVAVSTGAPPGLLEEDDRAVVVTGDYQ